MLFKIGIRIAIVFIIYLGLFYYVTTHEIMEKLLGSKPPLWESMLMCSFIFFRTVVYLLIPPCLAACFVSVMYNLINKTICQFRLNSRLVS